MDKYEYKVRADEIKELIAAGEYPQAAEIADTVDWRRVKSVMMLCTISDLYKINRRYEDAKNMLLLAYERRPGGKTICYSLCELCIKTEEFVQAVNYYKEFVQVAPKDPGRYILQYKLYEAQDVSLEERIGVLEELKKRDYREKWAYELAYLYHRVGLATRCVEECDELILWFGEGKYVIKAMELKMLHQPLTAGQQEKYDHRFDPVAKHAAAAGGQSGWGSAGQGVSPDGWENSGQEPLQGTWEGSAQPPAQDGWGGASQEMQQGTWEGSAQPPAQDGWGGAAQEMQQGSWQGSAQEPAQDGWGVSQGTPQDGWQGSGQAPARDSWGASQGTPQGGWQGSAQEPTQDGWGGAARGTPQNGWQGSAQEPAQDGWDASQGTPQDGWQGSAQAPARDSWGASQGMPQDGWQGSAQEPAQDGWDASQGTPQDGWQGSAQAPARDSWGASQGMPQDGWQDSAQPLAQDGWGGGSQEMQQGGWEGSAQEPTQDGRMNSSQGMPQDVWEGASQGAGQDGRQDSAWSTGEDAGRADARPYAGWTGQETGRDRWAVSGDTRTDWVLSGPEPRPREAVYDEPQLQEPEELDIQVKPLDMGAYNTINLQAEIAAGLQEVLADNKAQSDEITRSIIAPLLDSDTESLDLPEIDEVDEDDLEPEAEIMEDTEVFFGETGEIGNIRREEAYAREEGGSAEEAVLPEGSADRPVAEDISAAEDMPSEKRTPEETKESHADETARIVMDQIRMETLGQSMEQVLTAQPPRELAGVLSQESDGQISLVVPEKETVEKQITGQMNFEDILDEWEKLKQENKEKQQEEMRRHVLEQTGEMFTEFEKSVKDGLLERLENGQAENTDGLETQDGEEEPENGSYEEAVESETDADGEADAATAEEVLLEDVSIEAGEAMPEGGEEMPEAGTYEEAVESETGADGEADAATTEDALLEDTSIEAGEAMPEGGEEMPEAGTYEEAVEPENGADGEADAASTVAEEEIPVNGTPEEKPEEQVSGPETGKRRSRKPESRSREAADRKKNAGKEPSPEKKAEVTGVRALTRDEKELYAPFIQSRSGRERLVKAIDSISMAAYTGNVIITGERGMDTMSLAKNMIREIQMTDSNFSGKVAKISGQGMNSKNMTETLERLNGGALIIQKISDMEAPAVEALQKSLQKENLGIIVFMEDTRKAVDKFLETYPKLRESFTARMDVEAMSNDSLVAFGRQYARELEYSIDDLGILALHTRIEERQTLDHVVTAMEVKDIVDDAIRHVNKKTLGHFFDILFARRYDEEDMIILTEKDFE